MMAALTVGWPGSSEKAGNCLCKPTTWTTLGSWKGSSFGSRCGTLTEPLQFSPVPFLPYWAKSCKKDQEAGLGLQGGGACSLSTCPASTYLSLRMPRRRDQSELFQGWGREAALSSFWYGNCSGGAWGCAHVCVHGCLWKVV
jgi:hypothetical protein